VSTRLVALLTLAALINYVDRGNLATAGPLIQDQLELSHTQLGVLLAAFFWSYAPAQSCLRSRHPKHSGDAPMAFWRRDSCSVRPSAHSPADC
jgi:sugar phosphate permease